MTPSGHQCLPCGCWFAPAPGTPLSPLTQPPPQDPAPKRGSSRFRCLIGAPSVLAPTSSVPHWVPTHTHGLAASAPPRRTWLLFPTDSDSPGPQLPAHSRSPGHLLRRPAQCSGTLGVSRCSDPACPGARGVGRGPGWLFCSSLLCSGSPHCWLVQGPAGRQGPALRACPAGLLCRGHQPATRPGHVRPP